MSIRIGSNVASLNAQRRLADATATLASSAERLASGQRINRAADDAAGLAVASSLNVQGRIYSQAIKNLNDTVSLTNIAKGSLDALKEIAYRQRELATQSANEVYTLTQRDAMDKEAHALTDEYNRIVRTTSFNGMRLFPDNHSSIAMQAGSGSDAAILSLDLGQGLHRNVGDGTFSSANYITEPAGWPGTLSDVGVGDFNKDGKLDFAATDVAWARLLVYTGNGDGTFSLSQSFVNGAAEATRGLSITDLNNDGNLDIATARSWVYLGRGNGTFSKSSSITAGTLWNIETADFNHDGIQDAVSGSASAVNILIGRGDGTFLTAATLSTNSQYASQTPVIGDFNGDGNLDVAVNESTSGGRTIKLFFGTGTGAFGPAITVNTAASRPEGLVSADFNGDGRLDLAFGLVDSASTSVMLSNGDGTFRNQLLNFNPRNTLTAVDANGDGIPDLAGADSSSQRVSVMLGNGDGTFKAPSITGVVGDENSTHIAFGDFNNDGAIDVVRSNGNTNCVMFANAHSTAEVGYLNIHTVEGARDAMNTLDSTLGRISSELGYLGAFQSRLQVALSTLSANYENVMAAAGRITDTDIGYESANQTKQQIIQQSASAILAQANQGPAIALALLR